MVTLDRLGRRWALRILWELREGPLTFRALRTACDEASPSVINDRLSELRELGIVDQTSAGYVLTRHGQTLGEALLELDERARAWSKRTRGRKKSSGTPGT